MRPVAVITGLLTVFCVAVALVISLAIAIGALIHSWVPEIDMGSAALMVMAGLCIVGAVFAGVIKALATAVTLPTDSADDQDDEMTDEEEEDEAEIFAARVSEALFNRMVKISPYANAARRQRDNK